MHFNRWLDCTEEECIAINSGQPIANVAATEAARFDAEAKARLGQIAGKFSKSNNLYFQDSFKQFHHLLIIALQLMLTRDIRLELLEDFEWKQKKGK